ncbi:MAG: valine--tRNA ligase, partial [Prevotellaceae bacterium]|nr:valine--tRNA ligase [Prevotellaceae bacterium]
PAPKEGACLIIATTRPETIMADVAIAVNPNDERHFHLHGKKVLIPLIDKEIPVITDNYVATDFGTGCLKVTPAHDINDYEIGLRHKLPVVDILNADGHLNEKAQILVGEERFAARKKIVKMLEEAGHLLKEEDYKSQIGFSERTNAVIEPRLSLQWFLKMDELAKPALASVMNDEVKLIPEKFRNTYRHWMENVHDWCISRQLWWGQRIPAWYLPTGEIVVASNEAEALKAAQAIDANLSLKNIQQDEDVVDTWFSSWLWPISVFDPQTCGCEGHQPNANLQYYYPTNTLVTAPEILFFWVARMIMAGHEFIGKVPFKNVYLTGIVRDKQGRKMSKQLGNSPEPLNLIDKYGADGVRMGMLLTSPAGNDLPFEEGLCEQGRNFNNKIWNAFRLVHGWQIDNNIAQPKEAGEAIAWFEATLHASLKEINEQFEKFRLSEALMSIYTLFWDEFSSWYLEMVKPAFGAPIDAATYNKTLAFFDKLLKIMHPFLPFITEELWQQLGKRKEGESIMMQNWPIAKPFDTNIIKAFEQVKAVTAAVRNLRQEKGISPKEALLLYIKGQPQFTEVICKMANLSSIESVNEQPDDTTPFRCDTTEYFIKLTVQINIEEELVKLNADLAYQQKFFNSIRAKLGNEKFVSSAPEQIVAIEHKKQADTEIRIRAIEEQIASLKK